MKPVGVTCNGLDHQIMVRANGRLSIPHSPEEIALELLGGNPCPCVEILAEWRTAFRNNDWNQSFFVQLRLKDYVSKERTKGYERRKGLAISTKSLLHRLQKRIFKKILNSLNHCDYRTASSSWVDVSHSVEVTFTDNEIDTPGAVCMQTEVWHKIYPWSATCTLFNISVKKSWLRMHGNQPTIVRGGKRLLILDRDEHGRLLVVVQKQGYAIGTLWYKPRKGGNNETPSIDNPNTGVTPAALVGTAGSGQDREGQGTG